MSGNKFNIKLTMGSDWQVGTGAGIPGGVDELISRDAEGFPQVPAKTIVGIWRDALERLTLGLDGGNRKGEWSKWIEVIFGSQPNVDRIPHLKPVPAILSLTPARISPNLRAAMGTDKRLKQALTFVKVGVKIDEDSEAASNDMLRFEEMGRTGTILETEVELEKTNEIIEALLILSAKMAERIGGKRRRGAGKCNLEIVGKSSPADVKNAAEKIRAVKDKEFKELNQNYSKTPKKTLSINSPQNPDWQTSEYTLTLETPVSIVTAVLGNVSETLDYIPGTYLISHFGQNVFQEILKGNFQISPATVCIEGARALPVPKIFAQEKMDNKNVYNRLLEDLEGKKQTKPVRGGFYVEKGGAVLYANTPETILMHNAVDDDYQRPTSDVVGVYSREAIKAGTILKGEIRYRNMDINLKQLDGKVRVGTSKKDDYGTAEIKFKNPQPFKAKSGTKQNEIVVYLASDVLLRGRNLRQTNSAEDLAEALGLAGEKITFEQIQTRRIESWQTSWGFPRPTLTVMQAGSVVRFETSKTIDFAKLETEGIGERRGEGYGQIVFNPAVLEKKGELKNGENENLKLIWEKRKADKFELKTEPDKIEDEDFAKLVEETAWREEIKLAVSKIAADDVKKEKAEVQVFGFKGLNMSQIGGLRSVVMRLRSKADRGLVENWLRHLEKTSNRLKTWETFRLTKVRNLLEGDNIWNKLKEEHFHEPKSLTAGNNLKDELWAEAVKSLFYACQMAHKRETEKRREEKANGTTN
jgi:CRISPR-associated protein Csx10